MDETNLPSQPGMLGYATPARPSGSSAAAGIGIALTGLGLIVLGGCFLIGVLISQDGSFGKGKPTILFLAALYTMAFICFAAAACVLWIGLRKLIRIGRP